jgi:hypothetical protein
MKKLFILLTSVLLALPALAEIPPALDKEIQIAINGVFVPGSFDSNTEAYVVVNGIFPNGCYKWNRAEINNVDTFNHEVVSIASVTQGMCIMVLVPFQKDVSLGKLATGEHTLKFLSNDGTYLEKNLIVE